MPHQQAMADLFARHMDAELAGDLETTLATMTDNPHLVNVPSMVGGAGREGVRAFYADHLVGKFFPPDVEFTEVSRTFGDRRLVDELLISFTPPPATQGVVPPGAPPARPSWACATQRAFPSPAGKQPPRFSTRPYPARTCDPPDPAHRPAEHHACRLPAPAAGESTAVILPAEAVPHEDRARDDDPRRRDGSQGCPSGQSPQPSTDAQAPPTTNASGSSPPPPPSSPSLPEARPGRP